MFKINNLYTYYDDHYGCIFYKVIGFSIGFGYTIDIVKGNRFTNFMQVGSPLYNDSEVCIDWCKELENV